MVVAAPPDFLAVVLVVEPTAPLAVVAVPPATVVELASGATLLDVSPGAVVVVSSAACAVVAVVFLLPPPPHAAATSASDTVATPKRAQPCRRFRRAIKGMLPPRFPWMSGGYRTFGFPEEGADRNKRAAPPNPLPVTTIRQRRVARLVTPVGDIPPTEVHPNA